MGVFAGSGELAACKTLATTVGSRQSTALAASGCSSSAWMDTPESPEAPADAPWNPQYVAIAILIVVVPLVLWRRRGGSSEDDNYETDETGRRRKIMHGDL